MAGSTALRYRDIGRGEKTILLIHGYLGSIEVWDDFAGQLGKGYRVISFDVPGHGISELLGEVHTMEMMAKVAKDLLDKIGVDKVSVIGHSMGGYIALALAEANPQLIDKLVLFHSLPLADSQQRAENRVREIEIIKGGRKELITSTQPSKLFAPQNVARYRTLADEFSEQAMLTEEEGIVALLRGMGERCDRTQFLNNAPFPALYILGRHDQIISPERAAEAVAATPNVKVEWLENSGHIGFVEQQNDSLDIVSEFIG